VERQLVTLGLGDEVFAVPVEQVCEILDYRPVFAIPEGPAYFLGLTDVRGVGAPTLDLRARLGLPRVAPDLATRILVVSTRVGDRDLMLGLVADRVFEVATVTDEEIGPAPDIGPKWRSDYITGVVSRGGRFIVILNLQTLLASADIPNIHQAA
jgi:purine-binding chemotaxis protein CheW